MSKETDLRDIENRLSETGQYSQWFTFCTKVAEDLRQGEDRDARELRVIAEAKRELRL